MMAPMTCPSCGSPRVRHRYRLHRFAVVLLPSKEMATPAQFESRLRFLGQRPEAYDLERPRTAMTEFLRAQGIPFLDLVPALRDYVAAGHQDFFEWDVHMTESGHATVAPLIATFIEDQLESR
jgi:hypothetical protein